MPATVFHNLSATTPDDPSYEIRPSHWNESHGVSLNLSASEIAIQKIGAAQFDQLQEIHDLTRSAGHLDGGAITDAGGGSINVAAGQGFIRATNDDTSTLFTFSWPAPSAIAIPDNSIRYVRVNYNAGSPIVTVSTSEDYDYRTSFPLGFVIREAGTLTINDTPHSVGRGIGRLSRRNAEVDGRSRANALGGIIISEVPTKQVAVTAGTTWFRGIREVFPAFDSSAADRFDRYYRDGAGGWTREAAQATLPLNTYDDGTGVLATVGNNNYANYWFYLGPGNNVVMVYGRGDFNSLAAAQAAGPPGDLPLRLQVGSLLIGRFITNRSGATSAVVLTETAFTGDFVPGPVSDHGALAGLADDDHPQYHQTSLGVIRQLSAGTEAVTSGSIQFSNSNGVSFGLNAGTLTASVAPGGGGDGGNTIAAGTRTAIATGSVLFSNENGISFGLDAPNGTRLTASHNALTTAALSNHSHGNPQLNLTNLSGTTNSNSAGFTLSLSASQSNQAASASNGSFAFQTLNFSNANNVTFGTSAGGIISASVSAQSVQPGIQSISGGTTRLTTGEAVFSNSNGVSFGVNGQTITASHNGLTTAALSNHSHGNPQLNLTNLSGTTNSNSAGFTLSLSAAAPGGGGGINGIAVNALTTYTSGTVVFSAGPNITLNTNGQTVSISAAAGGGGGGGSQRWQQLPMIRFSLSNLTPAQSMTARPFFIPFTLANDLTVSRANWEMSRSTTGNNEFSVTMGIFTYVNDTQLSLLTSFSGNFSNTATASISGIRRFGILAANTFNLTPGGYVFGMQFGTVPNTSGINYSIRGHSGAVQLGAVLEGTDNYNTATSYNIFPFFGRFSTTTAVFPNSVADSQVIGQFSGASAPIGAWIGLNKD